MTFFFLQIYRKIQHQLPQWQVKWEHAEKKWRVAMVTLPKNQTVCVWSCDQYLAELLLRSGRVHQSTLNPNRWQQSQAHPAEFICYSFCRSDRLCVCGAAAKGKPRAFTTPPYPEVSPRQLSRVQKGREHLPIYMCSASWSPLLGIQYLMHRQGLIWREMKWLGSKVN